MHLEELAVINMGYPKMEYSLVKMANEFCVIETKAALREKYNFQKYQ